MWDVRLLIIVSNLKYKALIDDIESVIQTLIFKEIQVETKDGCWYLMRIMPYRTLDNIIDGVVIIFVDIAAIKQIEALRFNEYKIEHNFPKIGRRVVILNARRIMREDTGTQMILLAMEDITEGDKKS